MMHIIRCVGTVGPITKLTRAAPPFSSHLCHESPLLSNDYAFPSFLKLCASNKDLKSGTQIHCLAYIHGRSSDNCIANTLIALYAKCGQIDNSFKVFDEIPHRTLLSWNTMLSTLLHANSLPRAASLFHRMLSLAVQPDHFTLSTMLCLYTRLHHAAHATNLHSFIVKLGFSQDPFSQTSLVDMYSKVGSLHHALAAFQEIVSPNTVSWNILIAGCVLHGNYVLGIRLFQDMRRLGARVNSFTLSSALKASSGLEGKLGIQIHGIVTKMDFVSDDFIRAGLVDVYSRKGVNIESLLKGEENSVAWNAAVSGFCDSGLHREAVRLFITMRREGVGVDFTAVITLLKSVAALQDDALCKEIHSLTLKRGFQSDNRVVSGLITSYGKCACTGEAAKVYAERDGDDLVVETSMTSVYSQNGEGEEALMIYVNILRKGYAPDLSLCTSILNACANLSVLEQGKQAHVHVIKHSFDAAGDFLINMYAKCGSIEDARKVFGEIPTRGIVSFSAMIAGLAQHGNGFEALELFNLMIREKIQPNNVTMVSVLRACNNCGLVSEAERYFKSMRDVYGVEPAEEHYACMVDILGRAGRFSEAMEVIKATPFERSVVVWGSVLGAARIHKNAEVGMMAAEMVAGLRPEKSSTDTMMASIYASAEMWDQVAEVRRKMKTKKMKKEPGMSWIEVKDEIHAFIAGDRSHLRTDDIYSRLRDLLAASDRTVEFHFYLIS